MTLLNVFMIHNRNQYIIQTKIIKALNNATAEKSIEKNEIFKNLRNYLNNF